MVFSVVISGGLVGQVSASPEYITPKPLVDVISIPVSNVKDNGEFTEIPMITWGGDIATILANGGQSETSNGSIFSSLGLKLKLKREDVFTEQLKHYISGKTPYLRCTLGMCAQALELLSKDDRTKPVIIYQMTWSSGGDALVTKQGLMNMKQLKDRTVAIQAYGPHVDFMTTLLTEARMTVNDINIRWLNDLAFSPNSPPEAFRESEVDAAFVIVPDALTLTSNRNVGTGRRGSVKGARMVTSTMYNNRIIADVYAVRSDYLNQHRDEVERFVKGLLLAEKQLHSVMKDMGSKNRLDLLYNSAEILLDDREAISDIENLYFDATFVGLEGNKLFFNNQEYNRNMDRLSEEIQVAFQQIGLLSREFKVKSAAWDYSRIQ